MSMAYALFVFQTTWLVIAAIAIAAMVVYLIFAGFMTWYINLW